MSTYEIKIESENEVIEFNLESNDGGNAIQKVEFMTNTLNDNTRNRSSAVRCELHIKGTINKQTKSETLKLARWSLDSEFEKSIYRKVTVKVYATADELMREYDLEEMFCIDYKESYASEKDGETANDAGVFDLYIAQREGKHVKDLFAD